MPRFFNQLFNIRTEEWPRLLLLYLIFFVYIAGSTWGEVVVEAAFLQQVGVEFLPYIFMLIAIVSIPAAAVYTAFADRISNDRLLIAILIIGILGIGIGRILLGLEKIRVVYSLLYLIMFVPLSDIFVTHWYTYVNGFYDTRSAKRIIPILVTSGRLASIFAGLTMPVLNHLFSLGTIITLWMFALGLVALLAWLTPRLLKETGKSPERLPGRESKSGPGAHKGHFAHLANIREGCRYVLGSSFLLWMASGTLLVMILINLIQYRTGQILVEELQTTERISNVLGLVTGIGNLIMLPVLLFLLSRIIGRIGLGNTNLIFPLGNAIFCGGLIVSPSLLTAALAHFDANAFRVTFRSSVNSLLYNAVPLRVKGRARAFIDGLVAPFGSLIGGGLLLLLPLISLPWVLPGLIGVLSVIYLVNGLAIRKQYARALITLLEQEDFSFLLSGETTELSAADPNTLDQLRKKLEESTSYEFTAFLAQIITQIGGNEVAPLLGEAARTAKDARTRSALIDALVAAQLRGEAVRELYIEFLEDPDGRVRQSALAGLEQIGDLTEEPFLSSALKMLDDSETDVRFRALLALSKGKKFYVLPGTTEMLNRLLNDPDPHQRARGIQVLGQTCPDGCDEPVFNRLVGYLTDPADEVRLKAALTIESLPVEATLTEPMTGLLNDPVERIRGAAVSVLGRIGTPQAYEALLRGLTDPSPQIRNSAADVLAGAGRSVIALLRPNPDSPVSLLRKMAGVILSRIDPHEYGSFVREQIAGNLLTIYSNLGRMEALKAQNGYSGIRILQSAVHERNRQLRNENFDLLSALHNPNDVKTINESFLSEDPLVRANAVEALESITSPQTADLIAPLFESDLSPDRLLSLCKKTWNMNPFSFAQAFEYFLKHSDDAPLRAIAAFALGEMGAALCVSSKTFEPQRNSAGQRPVSVRKRVNPLDALIDLPQGTEPSVKPKKHGVRRSMPKGLFDALSDASDSQPAAPARNEGGERIQSEPSEEKAGSFSFTLLQIREMLKASLADESEEVRLAAQAAERMMNGIQITKGIGEERTLLSAVEKIIFLKEVPFFQGMTVDQLKVLANVCEEKLFEQDTRIFSVGDPGGVLYVVVNGRVGIEQEKRKGYFVRLATLGAHSYFGETDLFENNPRTTSAVAIGDTLVLSLRREPLIALARRHPDLSLELINVLSRRLRESNDRIAELTRTRPRELHKLFDQYD